MNPPCTHNQFLYLWVGLKLRYVTCNLCKHSDVAPNTWQYNTENFNEHLNIQ